MLKLVIGPMGAGKSTFLLREIGRFSAIGKKSLAINFKDDLRYGDQVIGTHSGHKVEAHMCSRLSEVLDIKEYGEAALIVINEAQFFEDVEEINKMTKDGKYVIAAALVGDIEMKPFGSSYRLIPMADEIVHLRAMCVKCNDGTEASFTGRFGVTQQDGINIGGLDTYMPMCRKHFFDNI